MKLRQATELIGALERGELAADLTEEIARVVQGCQEAAERTGKAKGLVTLKLAIEVEGKTATIEGSIEGKPPKLPRERTLYFVSNDGTLSTEHPQQTDMFIREAKIS